MTDAIGWPGEPGVPLNPEKTGHHFLKPRWQMPAGHEKDLVVGFWSRLESYDHSYWIISATQYDLAEMVRDYDYVGPCLTPTEVAQHEREDELRGFEMAAEWLGIKFGPHRSWPHVMPMHMRDELCAELARRREEAGT